MRQTIISDAVFDVDWCICTGFRVVVPSSVYGPDASQGHDICLCVIFFFHHLEDLFYVRIYRRLRVRLEIYLAHLLRLVPFGQIRVALGV